jgi:GlcNAc-P-P-Und epimerase
MAQSVAQTRLESGHSSVLILGGSGFIGTQLADILREANLPVAIGDLHPSARHPDISLHCDVRQRQSLLPAVQGATAIINLAAEHRDDVFPVSRYYETNVQGAETTCAAARAAGVQTLVFTSSAAVYGFQPRPVDESGPFEPFNAYGETKWQAEAVYRAWAAESPSRCLVIVRPTVVFGEGNRGNVYNLLHQIASGRFLMVGSGRNKKSMAYAGNIAAFLAYCLSFGPGVHVFNNVDGPDMTTRTLVDQVRRCLGRIDI